MKINNFMQKSQLLISKGEANKGTQAESNSVLSNPQGGDSVNISHLISCLHQMMSGDDASQAGSDRVAALKSSIGSGAYYVSGLAVASKIIGIKNPTA